MLWAVFKFNKDLTCRFDSDCFWWQHSSSRQEKVRERIDCYQ